MPELGELQAHVERLDRDLAGAHLERFDVMVPPALKTATPSPEVAYHHPVAFVGRRGLYLLVDFGIATFVVGLGAHGRLGPDDDKREAAGVGVARWQFGDGRAWVLADTGPEPAVGLWVVLGNPEQQPPLAGLGPDANDVSPGQLFELLRSHPSILHDFLLDQRMVAGLGARLANEVCHRAKRSPFVSTLDVTIDDAERLVEAIHACVNEDLAVERGHSDMGDVAERPGRVDRREGEPCPVCGDLIRRIDHGASSVFWCPTCQAQPNLPGDVLTGKLLE